jgi:hypothetical protein
MSRELLRRLAILATLAMVAAVPAGSAWAGPNRRPDGPPAAAPRRRAWPSGSRSGMRSSSGPR